MKIVIEVEIEQQEKQEPEVRERSVRLMHGTRFVHIVRGSDSLCNRRRYACVLRETDKSVATCAGCIVAAFKELR